MSRELLQPARNLAKRALGLSRSEAPPERPIKMIIDTGVQDDMRSLHTVKVERVVSSDATHLDFHTPGYQDSPPTILTLVARWGETGVTTVEPEEVSTGTTAEIDYMKDLLCFYAPMPISAILEDGRIFYRMELDRKSFVPRLKAFLEYLAKEANPFDSLRRPQLS